MKRHGWKLRLLLDDRPIHTKDLRWNSNLHMSLIWINRDLNKLKKPLIAFLKANWLIIDFKARNFCSMRFSRFHSQDLEPAKLKCLQKNLFSSIVKLKFRKISFLKQAVKSKSYKKSMKIKYSKKAFCFFVFVKLKHKFCFTDEREKKQNDKKCLKTGRNDVKTGNFA